MTTRLTAVLGETDTITIVVTESVTRQFTIDPNDPRFDWLLRYPRSDWKRLLEDDANITESSTEQALDAAAVDGAYREVEIIGGAQ